MTSDDKTPKTADDKVKKPGMMGDGTEEQISASPATPAPGSPRKRSKTHSRTRRRNNHPREASKTRW